MNSKKKCRYCKTYAPVAQGKIVPLGFFCSVDCAAEHGRQGAKKAAQKQFKKELKQYREKSKTLSQWLNELQALVNKYVRLRDINDGCISCDKDANWQGQWHASHYHPRGRAGAIRFNLWNLHKACSICNNHLSGNLTAYRPRLEQKIGPERLAWIDKHQYDIARYDVEYIKKAIRVAKKAVKRIERRNANQTTVKEISK